METKLTLQMEEGVIEQARRFAQARGVSLSQLVADFFTGLSTPEKAEADALPPITRSLLGVLSDERSKEEYGRYLEEKYR